MRLRALALFGVADERVGVGAGGVDADVVCGVKGGAEGEGWGEVLGGEGEGGGGRGGRGLGGVHWGWVKRIKEIVSEWIFSGVY